MENIDATDFRILRHLQQDASLTNVELAAQVRLSPSPTLARVKRLESEGVISSYVALVDPLRLGLKVNVFVRVALEKQEAQALERFEQAVSHFDEVMEVGLLAAYCGAGLAGTGEIHPRESNPYSGHQEH